MAFEDRQRSYYLHELNRTLPTRGANPDAATLQLALGNTDPTMPAATRTSSDARNFVSEFGAKTSAQARDTECRSIPYPGTAMRAADARAGCGWWFSPDPSIPSIGAYGTRRGPMSPTLDTQIGPGQWIWDTQQAAMMESMKMSGKIQTCQDLQYSPNPNIGWCAATGRAIATDGAGNPAYPQMAGGDCPGPIIMTAAGCPSGSGSGSGSGSSSSSSAGSGSSASAAGGISNICQSANGVLSPTCLQGVVGNVCSPNGLLAQSLGSAYAGSSDSFNAANNYLLQRGFTLHSGIVNDGRLSVQDAMTSANGLRTFANTGDGSRATSAALNLCYGTPFDPCLYQPTDSGPFDPRCITQTALGMGYNGASTLLQNTDYWKQFKTWADLVQAMTWWKQVADKGPAYAGTAADQANAIQNVYGLSIKYPKQGCNNFGVLMYRYFFPTWDGTLFPPQGPQTHFLGRYIFKNGFPSQGSTTQDMTPAGGYLTEGQRMVADFYPTTGGTYQFLIACDDYVRLQVNGQVLAEVGCCSVPTPSQTVQMVADQPYEMIIDLWNGGGPWSFTIAMSVGGSAWAPIPLQQLSMVQDRRLPTIELAFNKMPVGTTGTIEDTDNVFQNFQLVNSTIGTLNGKQCMLVTGPGSGVFNMANYIQGVRLRAMKSLTMMVQISSLTPSSSGLTPSIVGFYNLPDTNITAYPRKGLGPQPFNYIQRTNDFMITANGGTIYPWGIQNPTIGTSGFGNGVTPYALGQWFHYAFVWNDDFAGYTTYFNGTPGPTLPLPPYDVQLMMEQIRIGCDVHPEGQSWTGGIAWFRAFDYQLSKDLVQLDMNDGWGSVV